MKSLLRALAAAFAVMLLVPSPASASNDPEWGKQWGPQYMNSPSAWAKSRGAGVTVAVVDSGVDVDHPDLKPKLDLANSYDYGDGDANPDDDSTRKDGAGKTVKGHGTHVAGITAAATDNGVGIGGVAPDAKIMAMKVFPSGNGTLLSTAAVTQAIDDAVNRGAKVINLSLGTFDTGISLIGFTQTPCSNAFNRGALCVVAAGNSGAGNPSGYPRDYPGLIVTAHDRNGNHAPFGQKADTQWAVSAPGMEIHSTWPVEDGGYRTTQGTSMAAPHAAGLAALVYADLKPAPTAAGTRAVIDAILSGARSKGDPATSGAGLIDAAATLKVPVKPATNDGGSAEGTLSGSGAAASGGGGKRSGGGGQAPAPAPGAPEAATGQPAAGGEAGAVTDPTAPQTKGIQLAGAEGGGEQEAPTKTDGGKATLYAIAAAMVLLTGGWTGSNYAKDLKSKRLKPFSEA